MLGGHVWGPRRSLLKEGVREAPNAAPHTALPSLLVVCLVATHLLPSTPLGLHEPMEAQESDPEP